VCQSCAVVRQIGDDKKVQGYSSIHSLNSIENLGFYHKVNNFIKNCGLATLLCNVWIKYKWVYSTNHLCITHCVCHGVYLFVSGEYIIYTLQQCILYNDYNTNMHSSLPHMHGVFSIPCRLPS